MIDTQKNEPVVKKDLEKDWPDKEHGTRIEIELEGVGILENRIARSGSSSRRWQRPTCSRLLPTVLLLESNNC